MREREQASKRERERERERVAILAQGREWFKRPVRRPPFFSSSPFLLLLAKPVSQPGGLLSRSLSAAILGPGKGKIALNELKVRRGEYVESAARGHLQ